ncbi:MAG: SUMF1/EgtB/PvdO family nonheme iron enzyme [Cyclobacteriaceae bacterium]|nr:SUMF1/EgtB/PvdO family nonheme iron enzyme [Cyclobacteriaceae bacterium]
MLLFEKNATIKNRYRLLKQIGAGGFSTVWLATDELGHEEVVLKFYAPSTGLNSSGLDMFRKEYKINAAIPVHPHVLKANWLDEVDNKPFLIMPYCSGGSLFSVLSTKVSATGEGFSSSELYPLLVEVAAGLAHLHGNNIIHHDIKPDNVLLDGQGHCLLTDFGISSGLRNTITRATGTASSLSVAYAAPERFDARPRMSRESDVFSFGVMLYELVTGEAPWMGQGGAMLKTGAAIPELPEGYDGRLNKLLASCLSVNTEERPLAGEIVSFLKNQGAEGAKQPGGAGRSRQTARMAEAERTTGPVGEESRRRTAPGGTGPQGDSSAASLHKKKESGGALKYALVAIVLLLVGGGTAYYVMNGSYDAQVTTEAATTEADYEKQIVRAEAFEEAEEWQKALDAYRRAWAMPGQSQDMAKETYLEGLLSDQSEKEAAATREATDRQASETARLKTEAEEARREADALRAQSAEEERLRQEETARDAAAAESARLAEAQRQRDAEALKQREEAARRSDPFASDMVYVSGDTFTMGCTSEQSNCYDNETPTHRVTLSSFSISKYEVTQSQWESVMGGNPSEFKNCPTCPVEHVSWDDIRDFLRKLNSQTGGNYRLPTEAEWEYAARGGSKSRGYQYSGSNSLSSVAWYKDNSGESTHRVGTKSANELGLYDMSGNVLEWCQDWYGAYSGFLVTNPRGLSSGSGRVLRGGSWNNRAGFSRVAYRNGYGPGNRFNLLGFRVAHSSP